MNKVDTITAETFLPDPVTLYPATRRGFTPLRNPVLRKTMARVITIEQDCRRESVDLTELLNELEHMVVEGKVNSAQMVSITRIDQAQLI